MKPFYFLSVIIFLTNCSTSKSNISKIEFQADACFGTCPIFTMVILNDGTATYDAKEYNKQEGQFKTTIRQKQLDSLIRLFQQVDFFDLKNNYRAPMTDQPTYTLTVTLKDGKKKTIEDYGPSGPAGLERIYDFIFSLRNTQDWK